MMDGDLHLTKLDDQQAYLTNVANTYLGKKNGVVDRLFNF